MRVKVYRNLHKECYSIQARGLVVAHADNVTLMSVNFVVQPAGRQRVLDTKKKNVHAFAVGDRLFSNKDGVYDSSFTKIRYNPYMRDYFFIDGYRKVVGCEMLVLTPEGMFGKGLRFDGDK